MYLRYELAHSWKLDTCNLNFVKHRFDMHVVQYLMHHSTVMFDGTCVMLNKYIQCAVFIQFTMNLLWINYITLYNQLYIVFF